MTRRDRIVVLLEHYIDVEYGLQDRSFRGDEFIPRMCRAWSHPSYSELRRVIGLMRDTEPFDYWHLAETYFRYHEVRVAYCPRCEHTSPAADIGSLHKHGHKTVTLMPRTKRRVSEAIEPEAVNRAIGWIEKNFAGEPFIPDDLLAMVA